MPDVLRVALSLPRPAFYDYLPRDTEHADPGWIGCRVRVRLGRRALIGLVVETGASSCAPEQLRAIEQRIDRTPLLQGELWHSLRWLAGYYHAALGEVLGLALPGALREGAELPEVGEVVWQAAGGAPPRLRDGGAPQALWRRLQSEAARESELDASLPGWRAAARSLQQRGLAMRSRSPYRARLPQPAILPLNPAQSDAAADLRARDGFGVVLLHGVTGSGKTEVYLDLLADCVQRGRQALVLVPEIALTPQTERRFRARLGDAVLVSHSSIADGERALLFARMAAGEPRVVIGTRSAIFLPLPRPGLIVVDEEHDASYKQQDGVRYHARDFAVVRGRALNVPVLLGSATPALESLAQVARGRYALLRLPQRAAAAQPPAVQVVDLRKRPLDNGLASEALDGIRRTLDAGGQVLVFRNRRGFAPALLCHDCGWTADCARCDRPMTVHRAGARLICHHCGAGSAAPRACPACQGLALQSQGIGTERLEAGLRQRFPAHRIVRIDRDTTRGRDSVARLLGEIGDDPGILIGTQMLAKGHDLPKLDLVVVVGVDEGLFSGDFRSSERLAQLLIQVSGRAGRGDRPGRVLLQTHHPQHPLLAQLLDGGYSAFAEAALAERGVLGFPPSGHLALLRAEAKDEARALDFLRAARAGVEEYADPEVTCSGPMPAPHSRRAGFCRAQLLLSSHQRPTLQRVLDHAWPRWFELPEARRVRWSLDVDPQELY